MSRFAINECMPKPQNFSLRAGQRREIERALLGSPNPHDCCRVRNGDIAVLPDSSHPNLPVSGNIIRTIAEAEVRLAVAAE